MPKQAERSHGTTDARAGGRVRIQSPRLGRLENIVSLRVTVTNARNLTIGIVFGQIQCETAPSTSQIDNGHAILDLGPFTIELQHGLFRFRKGCFGSRPQSTGILLGGTKTQVIKRGGYFVVLRIGSSSFNGNGHVRQLLDQSLFCGQFLFDIIIFAVVSQFQ